MSKHKAPKTLRRPLTITWDNPIPAEFQPANPPIEKTRLDPENRTEDHRGAYAAWPYRLA